MKVQNKGGKGNPYRDDSNGQFASADTAGVQSATENTQSATNQQKQNLPDWLTPISKTSSAKPSSSLPDWLTKIGEEDDDDSEWEQIVSQVQNQRWWKNRDKVRTVDETIEVIDKFFDDEVLDVLEKTGFKTSGSFSEYFGQASNRTSHSSINVPLTNIIAKKMFHPITVIDSVQFDKEWKAAERSNSSRSASNIPYLPVGYVQRGVHNKDARLKDALGETDNNLILPNGCYGSCIYSAYDGYTARSYAGYNGYVFNYLIDNKNTVTSTNHSIERQQFLNNIGTAENKIRQHLKSKGKDDTYCDKVIRVFNNAAHRDETFIGLLMGYDCIYDTSAQYSLILNWKNVKTKKDW